MVDQVLDNHDSEVLEMKEKVETMWKRTSSKRERRTIASKEAPGYSFFGDNIGAVH